MAPPIVVTSHGSDHRGREAGTIVHHTRHELRNGLRSALDGTATPRLREVEAELRLAGFLTEDTTVTRAGQRFLLTAGTDLGSAITAA